MKKTNLQVSFDADKLNALQFYMAKKELKVEDELQAQLDKLYEKMVPVQVREYVESQFGSEAPKQEAKADEGKSSEKQPKQSKRQREKELATTAQPEPQQEQTTGPEEAEEENQGMSMSM